MAKINHTGLAVLAHLDIKAMIEERGEEDVIDVIRRLISNGARNEYNAEYIDIEQRLGEFIDSKFTYLRRA